MTDGTERAAKDATARVPGLARQTRDAASEARGRASGETGRSAGLAGDSTRPDRADAPGPGLAGDIGGLAGADGIGQPGGQSAKPLNRRVALVTGGTRGIGAAVTAKLAGWGASVAAGYVDRPGPAREVAAVTGATVHLADVTDPVDVTDLVADVVATHGRLDIVVHCAAAATYGDVTGLTDARWAFTQAASLESLRLLAAAARPHLAAAGNGRLVAVSNTTPHRIVPGAGALAAAKAGVEALTRYLAYELAPDGIVVNAVRPGLVPTDVMKVRPQYAATLAQERAASPWPGSRTTSAADVADVVAALCLPEMGWVSGAVIPVDGGASLWGWLPGGGADE